MPASRMAARTPSATFSTIAGRPISSGKDLGAHRGADDQPRFVRRAGLGVAREHRRMRRDDAVAAARPHHRDFRDLGFGAAAELLQHRAERLVGEDAGEIVDAAIAFGLADDGDHFIGLELSLLIAGLDAGGVLHVLQFDFGDFNSHAFDLRWFQQQKALVMRGPDPRIHYGRAAVEAPANVQVQPQHGLPGQARQ